MKDIPFKKCLIINNHVINEKDIEAKKEIILEYRKHKKIIEIKEGGKLI